MPLLWHGALLGGVIAAIMGVALAVSGDTQLAAVFGAVATALVFVGYCDAVASEVLPLPPQKSTKEQAVQWQRRE